MRKYVILIYSLIVASALLVGCVSENAPVTGEETQITQQQKQAEDQLEVEDIQDVLEEAQEEFEESLEEFEGSEITDKNKLFENSLAKNTVKGMTISLDDYKTEVRDENYAKITELTFTILNEGAKSFFPEVRVSLWDENDELRERARVRESIETDGYIDNGNYKTITVPVNIGFQEIELTKTIRLGLYDQFDFDKKLIVAVEKEFEVE